MEGKPSLCHRCKIFYFLAFVVFLFGVFYLLAQVATPITPSLSNVAGPAEAHAAEYYATYDLFNKHFTLLFTVFGILLSIFGIVVPLAFYFYQQNQFKTEFNDVRSHLEELQQNLTGQQENVIGEIEKQRDALIQEIEEQKILRRDNASY